MLAALKAFAAAQAAKKEPQEGAPDGPSAPAVEQKESSVISLLVDHLSVPRKDRSAHEVHASDLTKDDWCPRATAVYRLTNTQPKTRYLPVALRVTFDNGNAMASIIINKYLPGRARGGWECLKCSTYHVGKRPAPESPLCHHIWRYKELMFTHPTLDFTGSIDMFADLGRPDGKASVIEFKTKNPEEFKKMVGPDAEHRIRNSLYLHLIARQTTLPFPIDTESSRILYVSRGHGCQNEEYDDILPFKEYIVKRDEDDIKDALARAALVKKYKDTGAMPVRTCLEQWSAPAKYCSANAKCFGMTK